MFTVTTAGIGEDATERNKMAKDDEHFRLRVT